MPNYTLLKELGLNSLRKILIVPSRNLLGETDDLGAINVSLPRYYFICAAGCGP